MLQLPLLLLVATLHSNHAIFQSDDEADVADEARDVVANADDDQHHGKLDRCCLLCHQICLYTLPPSTFSSNINGLANILTRLCI